METSYLLVFELQYYSIGRTFEEQKMNGWKDL